MCIYILQQLEDEYHLQEPEKENILVPVANVATVGPAQDDSHLGPQGPAGKKRKSKVSMSQFC